MKSYVWLALTLFVLVLPMLQAFPDGNPPPICPPPVKVCKP